MLQANRQLNRIAVALIVLYLGLARFDAHVQIISPIKNQIIKYRNQSVLFNCTVTLVNNPNSTHFYWLRNNNPINPLGKQDTEYWSSFVLKGGLQVQDEGKYSCSYNGGLASVKVHLAEKPTARQEGATSPVRIDADDTPSLKCSAKGWPTPNITWLRNNEEILTDKILSKYEITSGDGRSELTISAAQKEDEGEYVCMARNELGEDNYTIMLLVEEAPKRPRTTMKAERPKYTAVVGTEAKLACIGEAVENDGFTWVSWHFKGGKLKNKSENHYLIFNDFFSLETGSIPKVRTQLSVLNVSFADSGNYTCQVKSNVALERDTVMLEVIPKDDGMKVWMIILICVLAVLLFFTLMVLIIVMCWRKRKRRKMRAAAAKYDVQVENGVFENDLFISYSGKDYDWVKESLLPLLDQNQINYIIHSRDFVPGKAFIDNMADSVYNSRKVILIMSARYLSSTFCKDEMRMAMHREASRDDASVIVVRIDNSVKTADIPKSLRHRTFVDVASQEEVATWQRRILDCVRPNVRTVRESVTSEESLQESERKSLLEVFKLKKKKRRRNNRNNAEQELANQA